MIDYSARWKVNFRLLPVEYNKSWSKQTWKEFYFIYFSLSCSSNSLIFPQQNEQSREEKLTNGVAQGQTAGNFRFWLH